MNNIPDVPIYYSTLYTLDDGPIHLDLPWIHLAGKGFNIRRLGPVKTAEHLGKLQERLVFVKGLRGGLDRSLRLTMFARLVKMRAQKCIYYIYSPLTSTIAALALLGVDSRRIIYHTQDFLQPERYPVRSRLEGVLARMSGLVISNETNRAAKLKEIYQLADMPLVVPTALPLDWPVPERSDAYRKEMLGATWRPDVRVIMHAGGYSTERVSGVVVDALEKLPENFVIVFTRMCEGSPAWVKCNDQARALGVERRIVYKSEVTFGQLMKLTANSDIGLLLYPNDGIGNYYQCPGRMTEYAVCGVPSVASDFPGLRVMIEGGAIGKVCDPCDPLSVASAIKSAGDWMSPVVMAEIKQRFHSVLAYEHGASKLEEAVLAMCRRLPE